MNADLANVAGFIGMALILVAYAYQTASVRVNAMFQHGLNLVGAVLLVASLLVHVNMASLVLESVWALIALFGLWKAVRARRASAPTRAANERRDE